MPDYAFGGARGTRRRGRGRDADERGSARGAEQLAPVGARSFDSVDTFDLLAALDAFGSVPVCSAIAPPQFSGWLPASADSN